MWKRSLTSAGSENDAIYNSITDFLFTSKHRKEDKIFNVRIKMVDEDVLKISIAGATNKVFRWKEDIVGSNSNRFPTRYMVKDDKLFYWNDPDTPISDEIIFILKKYDLLDEDWQNEYDLPPYVIDDGKGGVEYYICKNNYKKYKKKEANTIMKHYAIPTLKCN